MQRCIAVLSALLIAVVAPPAQTADGFVAVPDPLSGGNPLHPLIARPVPKPGERFVDARFGTQLTRVTGTPGRRHEYSRFDPFNRDQSRIVLTDVSSGELNVFKTSALPYDRKENFVCKLALEQPRWDPVDPDRLWGIHGFRIVAVNFQTGQTETVKDFAADPRVGPILQAEKDLYRVTSKDEGEPSRDMRFWALCLQGKNDDYRLRYILTWDRQTDKVPGLYKLDRAESLDWVGMSWSGKHVLIGADEGRGRLSGLTMADLELKEFHQLDHVTAHADVGLDVNGKDVVVMQNTRTDYIDLIPLDEKTRPTGGGDDPYQGTGRTRLVRLFYRSDSPHGLGSGVHISCNAAGYCVVSTCIEPNIQEKNWLDRSIILLKLDPAAPRAVYLAKVHATRGQYWEETHATITNDGSRIVWSENWNQAVGRERPFVMQLDLPRAWRD